MKGNLVKYYALGEGDKAAPENKYAKRGAKNGGLKKAVKAFSATKLEKTTSSYHHLLLTRNSPGGQQCQEKVVS